MKRLVIGILAHVDSGKTTLSEGMLYSAGEIRRLGRVDHKDAFLDTHPIEQERGITIFSKQAVLNFEDCKISLLDTPGHVDFSAETERTLRVLDYAILVISASEGVQSHTETLWRLLLKNNVPTFVFVNKMDLAERNSKDIIDELRQKLDSSLVDFSKDNENFWDDIAMCEEGLMESFLSGTKIGDNDISEAIYNRRIFPCFFGSALKTEGINDFLDGILKYTKNLYNNKEFGAKVFKIGEDENGNRLTYMKITGGELKVRSLLEYKDDKLCEKINGIRIYSGAKFKTVDAALAGEVCAVTGPSKTLPGMGFGFEERDTEPTLEPVLSYRISLEDGTSVADALSKFRILEEEEPQFNIAWNEQLEEIHIRIMGEVQIEVLKRLIFERFGIKVEFREGGILYKETIKSSVEGVGHYEPLRHYAEVHLLMEPTKPGSGLIFKTDCSEDTLNRNWQRLILTHLQEKTHLGVLTGSPITDMKITLVAGRAHLKHTEGGDFREATYRAVRQGLKMAESVLLEPWYDFKLEVPGENVGRAMTDISNMGGNVTLPDSMGEFSVILGSAPVGALCGYHTDVTAYTKGRGRLSCTLKGYFPCKNQEEVIEKIGYESDADLENTADSVFCSHGAGFLVKWDEVYSYMHIESAIKNKKEKAERKSNAKEYIESIIDDNELMAIFERTYGPIKREQSHARVIKSGDMAKKTTYKMKPLPEGPQYVLVDGYNIIFCWEDLKALAKENLEDARHELIMRMCEYSFITGCELILVFDAYKVKNNPGEVEKIRNINVVYTKEAETADMYIEKVTRKLSKKHRVRVATSDNLEQLIILGGGALRVSAENFLKEVEAARDEIREFMNKQK